MLNACPLCNAGQVGQAISPPPAWQKEGSRGNPMSDPMSDPCMSIGNGGVLGVRNGAGLDLAAVRHAEPALILAAKTA